MVKIFCMVEGRLDMVGIGIGEQIYSRIGQKQLLKCNTRMTLKASLSSSTSSSNNEHHGWCNSGAVNEEVVEGDEGGEEDKGDKGVGGTSGKAPSVLPVSTSTATVCSRKVTHLRWKTKETQSPAIWVPCENLACETCTTFNTWRKM